MERGLALAVAVLLLTSLAVPVGAWPPNDPVPSMNLDAAQQAEYDTLMALRQQCKDLLDDFTNPNPPSESDSLEDYIVQAETPQPVNEDVPHAEILTDEELASYDPEILAAFGIVFVLGIGYCILSSAGIEHAAENGIYFDTCVLCD